jgi:hypothetical protein
MRFQKIWSEKSQNFYLKLDTLFLNSRLEAITQIKKSWISRQPIVGFREIGSFVCQFSFLLRFM